MPGTAPTDRPPGRETAALVTQVVEELARQLQRGQDTVPGPTESRDIRGEARKRALVRLRALARVRQTVRDLEDQAAQAAAESGAGYPEIGRAVSMSRQGARRRWPGLITNTHRPAPHPTPRSS
ncbi:hypothetical protein [Streptomyces sp. NPDC050534]|uniref:hypothetical protein n=1 Tax=Streptomyces sp. NPDC050534 TaxID=3365625 RepID=UPI0037A81AED